MKGNTKLPKFSLRLTSMLLAEKGLSLAEKVILADIFSFNGPYNFTYPYIGKKLGLSRSTVIRSIERLSGKMEMLHSTGNSKNKGIELTEKALDLFDQKRKVSTMTEQSKDTPSSEASRLSSLFFDLITARKSDYRRPDLNRWADEIDRMIRIDNRSPERIEAVLRWCQNDSGNGNNWGGWQSVILSPKKLRDKFDGLEMKMAGNNKTQEVKSEYNIR
ncbi:MAG: hypothetical protein FVQ84_09200 [Planctomycetes bacterium]|nr:hypothetical protein [Planctomycetota bacterium]